MESILGKNIPYSMRRFSLRPWRGNLMFFCAGSRENYFTSAGRQNNNNNPTFQNREFVDSGFKKYLPTHIISACVKSMKAIIFLYFELVIVTNIIWTKVTYAGLDGNKLAQVWNIVCHFYLLSSGVRWIRYSTECF